MALDPEIKSMFRQTIHVAKTVAVTATGDNQYGSPEPRRVRLEHRNSVVHSAKGEELASDIRIIDDLPYSLSDRVWLEGVTPSDNEAEARQPKAVAVLHDEDGRVSHYEVAL